MVLYFSCNLDVIVRGGEAMFTYPNESIFILVGPWKRGCGGSRAERQAGLPGGTDGVPQSLQCSRAPMDQSTKHLNFFNMCYFYASRHKTGFGSRLMD